MNLQQLLDNLNSRDLVLRGDAERRLRALTPDELTVFIGLEQADFKRWARRQWIKIIPGWIALTAITVGLMGLLNASFKGAGSGLGSLFLAGYSGVFWYFRLCQHPHSRYALVVVIAELNSTRYVSTLLTMLAGAGMGGVTKKALDAALLRLLPQLHTGDADHWTSEQWLAFEELMRYSLVNAEVMVAALRALQQIGDQRFARRVQLLAKIRTRHNYATKPRGVSIQAANVRSVLVKQAAQECLPFIAQRQQKVEPYQTLLRASAVPASGDTLLRPAAPAVQEDHGEQLLRPAAGD